jgi:chromosome partitioning protein
MAKTIAVANEKGGVGKSVTSFNLGYALAGQGKKVLLVDLDGQANLTMLAGVDFPSKLPNTVCELLTAIPDEDAEVLDHITEYIMRVRDFATAAGRLDLIPSKEKLADTATALVSVTGREHVLAELLAMAGQQYDYVLIDCKPSIDVLTINALAAANGIIIPTNATALSLKGVEAISKHIAKVRKRINPRLAVEGILITMLDHRTRNAREALEALEAMGSGVNIFKSRIPYSIKMNEAVSTSKSIFEHAPHSAVAAAYADLCGEFLQNEAGRDAK